MRDFRTITDPKGINLPTSQVDHFFISFIRDPRDLPFIYLTLRITLTLLPLAVLLYLPFVNGLLWWVLAIVYGYLNNILFKGPFGLMLHCTSHRRLFKPEYTYLNYYLPWLLCPFFGQTPETYFSHHLGMLHVENNLDEDKSTTMYHQRDSLREFLRYFISFFCFGIFELTVYLRQKNRSHLANKAIVGEVSFWVLCILLAWVNLPATLVVFIFPFFLFRLLTMVGNWTQHAFVDASDPGNPYKNSITCINIRYNRRCWNDGYHCSHHIRPGMHWTEHPDFLISHLDQFSINKAIVFDGLDFMGVFYYLMLKRYDVLARHAVNIHGAFPSEQAFIQLLKERTRRLSPVSST